MTTEQWALGGIAFMLLVLALNAAHDLWGGGSDDVGPDDFDQV